jgi:hypothetical protein
MSQFYTNRTKNDLLLSDINITIKAGQTVNPYQSNPLLSEAELHESEQIGSLFKAMKSGKISKANTPPIKESDQYSGRIKESLIPMPTRIRFGTTIDPKKKQYIEELTGVTTETLSKFEDYADGFSEPEVSPEVLVSDTQPEPLTTPPDARYVAVKHRTR